MNTTFVTIAVLAACAAMGCSKETARDGSPGQTTTTGATAHPDRRDVIAQDLATAGDAIGNAAKKAAVEVKEEAKRIDIKVETSSPNAPCRGCDGGAALIRR